MGLSRRRMEWATAQVSAGRAPSSRHERFPRETASSLVLGFEGGELVIVGGKQTVQIVQTVQTALIGNLWLIKHRDLFLLSRWLDGGCLLLFNALLLSLTLL